MALSTRNVSATFLQYLDYNCFIIKKIIIVPWFWHYHFLPLSFLVILNFLNIFALSFGHFWRPCLRAQTQLALLFIKNATGGNSGGEGLHGLFPMSAVSLSATYKIKNFRKFSKIFAEFCYNYHLQLNLFLPGELFDILERYVLMHFKLQSINPF